MFCVDILRTVDPAEMEHIGACAPSRVPTEADLEAQMKNELTGQRISA